MDDGGREREIIVYGTQWCPGAALVRRYLEQYQIPFRWVDIQKDAEGRAFVLAQTGGYASVPTIVLPDGEVLVEPGLRELRRRLGDEPAGVWRWLRTLLHRQ